MNGLRKGRGHWASWGPHAFFGSQSGCQSHLPVSLILKEENQKSSGKELICKGKTTKRKPNSSTDWEGLDAIAWSSWAMWAAGPPRMTSMGSLSL